MVYYNPQSIGLVTEDTLTKKEDKSPDFLQEQLDLMGWAGSKPQTEEEQGSILDYITEFGRAPTLNEFNAATSGVDRSQFTYDPQSTMGKMGWENEAQYSRGQREGEIYGPLMDFTAPPPFVEPGAPDLTDEGILGQLGGGQVYQARLQDYINEQKTAAYPELQRMEGEYNSEIAKLDSLGLSQAEYNTQVAVINKTFTDAIEQSGIMTEEKAEKLLADAENALARGITGGGYSDLAGPPVEGLPNFADIQGIQGDTLNQLINAQRAIAEQTATSQREDALKAYQATIPPAYSKMQPEAEIITGTEQPDYYNYVNKLGLDDSMKAWLGQQYQQFFYEWNKSGKQRSFMEWVREKIVGGG